MRVTSAGVPNLSLTMYPFSISTDERVPLNVKEDEVGECKSAPNWNMFDTRLVDLFPNILSCLSIDVLNNKHKMIFENSIH